MLQLLSYNVFAGKNLYKIGSWLQGLEQPPDVLCFQEFPQKETKEFIALFKGYTFQFVPMVKEKNEEYGLLTAFNLEKIKLQKTTEVELEGELFSLKMFSIDIYRRSALLTEFTHNDKSFVVANTHLTLLAPNGRRIRQLEKITQSIEQNIPAIIAGDFNYSSLFPRKRLFTFMNEKGFACANPNMITHHCFLVVRHQLDYIFTKHVDVEHTIVYPVNYSDHLPILSQINL